jgi:NADH-quinone oxidoreductase subunit M
MILVLLIVILLLGGLLCWLVARKSASLVRWVALVTVLVDFILVAGLWIQYQDRAGVTVSNPWFINFKTSWVPALGIHFHMALDGLSMVLLVLTFFLGTLSVLCSWNEIRSRTGFYYFNLLWTLAGISGVFVAMDLFLFYFFWEVMLVPMYL